MIYITVQAIVYIAIVYVADRYNNISFNNYIYEETDLRVNLTKTIIESINIASSFWTIVWSREVIDDV